MEVKESVMCPIIGLVGLLAFGLGFFTGFVVAYSDYKNDMKQLHKEIGIEIVTTTIGDKTTHSYIVLDKKENK